MSFLREIFSFVREKISFLREIFSFLREKMSFLREIFSFVREKSRSSEVYSRSFEKKSSFLREIFSFVREKISFLRKIFSFLREFFFFVVFNLTLVGFRSKHFDSPFVLIRRQLYLYLTKCTRHKILVYLQLSCKIL